MQLFDTLFEQYAKLCSFCDTSFKNAKTTYEKEIVCHKGCFECCILETLNPLETFITVKAINWTKVNKYFPSLTRSQKTNYCPLIKDGVCTIYPHRPVICRTHGMPIILDTYTIPDYCELNFKNMRATDIKKDLILDIGLVTMNLMKLNLAFCKMLGEESLAEKRFELNNIVLYGMPVEIKNLINNLNLND